MSPFVVVGRLIGGIFLRGIASRAKDFVVLRPVGSAFSRTVAVDASVSWQDEEPTAELSLFRRKSVRLSPKVRENVLNDLLRLSSIVQDLQGE